MKKKFCLLFGMLFSVLTSMAQFEFDLSNFMSSTETISLSAKKKLIIKNMALNPLYSYSFKIDVQVDKVPPFDNKVLDALSCPEESATKDYIDAKNSLNKELDEGKISSLIEKLLAAIKKLDTEKYQACIDEGKELIKKTKFEKDLTIDLENNQTITITVIRKSSKEGTQDITWTKIFKTPEKTRWLVHYGLTYAPSKISKVDHYHSFADTSIANRFTITKDNNNGPKPWDNISATINFTYPFSSQSKDFDLGFTTGFGISTGLGLSGQAGLSAIIGENVILGSGIVMMQKQKLKGQYFEGQIIKENLAFDALHEKVWLPELYFTIGFRFGSNPFAAKSTDTPKSTTTTKPTP